MREYNPANSDDLLVLLEMEKHEVLPKLQPGEYVVVMRQAAGDRNTNGFQNRIQELNDMGYDVGKRDSEFGYQMPLPDENQTRRELRVFRR